MCIQSPYNDVNSSDTLMQQIKGMETALRYVKPGLHVNNYDHKNAPAEVQLFRRKYEHHP